MIEEAPQIKISGIGYPIYSADFSWGGADKPSSLSVSFVNKDGVYQKPHLGTNNPTNIKIGDSFTFVGYPVSYTSSNSTRGKILSVTYTDGSVMLDKIYIGLKGVHGAAPPNIGTVKMSNTTAYGSFNNIILLGEYLDPCENISDEYIDPCNPCVEVTEYQSVANNNDQKRVDCQTARLTQILDVIYSFTDLINALKSKGIAFYNTPVVKTKFYGRYTGSAREVLKSWCQDIGLTFVWHNDSVYFVDVKNGIAINDTSFYQTCSLSDYSESESIENSTSNGVILYFGAEGRIESYDCSGIYNPYRLSLIPITLKDLFWSYTNEYGAGLQPYIKKYYTLPKTGVNSILGLQAACLLSRYSRTLRDFILMYEYYEINTIDSSLAGKDMPLLGMKIKEAWRIGSSIGSSDNAPKLKTAYNEHIPESLRYLAEKVGGGMAIIEYNPEGYDKFYEFERALASDFIGKYWISFISDGNKYSINSPDGSPQYYDAGTPNTLPFIDFVPVSARTASTLLSTLVDDSAQKNKNSSHVGAVETANVNTFASSFILMERRAVWEPTEPYDDMRKLEEDLKPFHFYNTVPFKNEGQGDDLAKNEFYCLILDKPGTFDLIDKGEGDHPIEKQNENMVTVEGNYTTYYGLRSSRCKAYQLDLKYNSNVQDIPSWAYNVNIYMPPQSHDTFGSNYPGFTVIATKNSSGDANSKVFIEKQEVIFGDVPIPNEQSVAMKIDYKDITGVLTDIIEESGGSCGYNVNTIKQLIAEYYMKTSREKSVVAQTKTYTIGGFPTRELSILDGLSGFSIRYSAGEGVTSSISFSNSPPITVNKSIENQEFQKNILKRFIKKKMITSEDKVIV